MLDLATALSLRLHRGHTQSLRFDRRLLHLLHPRCVPVEADAEKDLDDHESSEEQHAAQDEAVCRQDADAPLEGLRVPGLVHVAQTHAAQRNLTET